MNQRPEVWLGSGKIKEWTSGDLGQTLWWQMRPRLMKKHHVECDYVGPKVDSSSMTLYCLLFYMSVSFQKVVNEVPGT